jgi:hypothetical protein
MVETKLSVHKISKLWMPAEKIAYRLLEELERAARAPYNMQGLVPPRFNCCRAASQYLSTTFFVRLSIVTGSPQDKVGGQRRASLRWQANYIK